MSLVDRSLQGGRSGHGLTVIACYFQLRPLLKCLLNLGCERVYSVTGSGACGGAGTGL